MGNKTAIKQLFPLGLGDAHEKDMEIEGAHLDSAQDSAARVLANAFADSAFELLTHWERVLDIVPPAGATAQSRSAACAAKMRERGGLSIPYFKGLAESRGFEADIVEHNTFQAGIAAAGDILYDDNIIWQWQVNVDAATNTYYFSTGESAAGDPLTSFGNEDLDTLFNDLKPAHTYVFYVYGATGVAGFADRADAGFANRIDAGFADR